MVEQDPNVGLAVMPMDNHINTTIIHQAITSKGDTSVRAAVIMEILRMNPQAAAIKNGYGSLPLHVIAQRNTKIDSATKDKLMRLLVDAYPEALSIPGGVGKRTPLHIIFTGTFRGVRSRSMSDPISPPFADYISPSITKMMIQRGRKACVMKDKKGYLPAHVACSRHCSPEKLRMLLEANPAALHDKTSDGHTLLTLAKTTATKSHPNFALIKELETMLSSCGPHLQVLYTSSFQETDSSARSRLGSNDSAHTAHGFGITSQVVGTPQLVDSANRPRKRKARALATPAAANLLLNFSKVDCHDSDYDEPIAEQEVSV